MAQPVAWEPPAGYHDLIGPREAATILGVHARALNRWAAAGKIPAVLLPSGRWKFRRSDITAILTGRSTLP